METNLPEVELNLFNSEKLSSNIKGFLCNIRNWELKKTKIKKDGSASIKNISKHRVVQRLFPCPVILIELQNDFSVLEFRLGQGGYSFEKQISNESILQKLQGAGETWHETFDQHQSIVWIVVSKTELFNLRYIYSKLEQAVESYAIDEMRMLQQIRDEALNDIGYHSVQLNRATGEPDIRIQATSRTYNDYDVPRALTSEDLVQDMMNYSKLSNLCPSNINDVMQRARLLYVHGYSEWEFLTMAVHYAVLSLEASLRLLYDSWLGSDPVVVEGKIDEASVCAKLEPSRDTILKWSNQQNVLNVKVKGWILPRSKSNLTNHAVHIGALTQWERDRIDYFLWLRDTLSHPTETFTEWINWSRHCIGEVCLYINQMWTRFLVGMPNNFSIV
ncbi:hypothetical protein HF638_17585 [Paenibacillus sp. SZ31]|uniref:hypothetical protein n=1 Tax=Paenibacillus sp. SZ31 TaxID=2725555 RepID=UPI001469FCC8|nr:hypothetical protein [Paenibacillus sp. SZ31]NMI05791.1 hypothetical protein [Paenibacillus sp. SZ31]